MDKVLRILRPLLTLNYKYPYAVVGLAIITAVVGAYFSIHLKINTNLANLLPEKNKHVQALHKLQNTVGGESAMAIAIKSPSFEDNIRFAKDLLHNSLQLHDKHTGDPFFDHGSYKRQVDILKNNALYFATSKELDKITSYLQDKIEESNKKANPFLINFNTDQKEDTTKKQLEKFEEVYNSLIPSKYSMSKDSTILLIHLSPTGSKTDLSFDANMFASLDSLINAMNPSSYNKAMEVSYANRWWSQMKQFTSIKDDVFNSFASGIGSVLPFVMLYFFIRKYLKFRRVSKEHEYGFWSYFIRMPISIIVIGFPLLISLTWVFGLTYWVLGELNTMTSVLFVILFGMGNAYGIHFYSRYIELRSDGESIEGALYKTYDNTGPAIMTSGLTTACSMFILLFASFRGFSEFGFIAGLGIVFALFCMLFLLPALLIIFERWNWVLLDPGSDSQETAFSFLPQRFPLAKTIAVVSILLVIAILINHKFLQFQYDFGKLQPTFEKAQEFDHLAGTAGRGHKRNPAYLLADSRQDVQEIVDTLRHRMRADTVSPTILDVEALPERFPKTKAQINKKLQKIAQIRMLLNKPIFKKKDSKQLKELRRASQTVKPLDIDQIPDYFKSRFTTKSGEIGNFVIVYPSVTLANGRKSIQFMHDVGEVTLSNGDKVYAASSSIIGAQIIVMLQKESPWLVGATFVMIFILMWLSFGSFRWALIGMSPLIIGFIFLFGIIMITGMKLNLYNLVILPSILGIGEDNGVHVVTRYIEEGKGSIWKVLTNTGLYITVASGTAMLGFAGLMFTSHPGLHSMGAVAIIGKGMTLFAAFTFLPAFIQWLEDKDWVPKRN